MGFWGRMVGRRKGQAKTGALLAGDPGAYVEEHRLTPAVEPVMGRPVIVCELLTGDHKLVGVVLTPIRAHKLSDDLLRAVAVAMRKDPPQTNGEPAQAREAP